MIFLRLNS